MVTLVVLQRDMGSAATGDPWFQDLAHRKDRMLVMVRDAVHNMGFQIGPPQPPVVDMVPSDDPKCPPGFYTHVHLRPHLERPPQDPKSPGAGGNAFQKEHMSPEEEKEKDEGMKRHCFNQFASDRISLSRSLGEDTRPPE